MLFLNQFQSTILFTSMRITLQLGTTYLITQILARAYNLTYMERTEAGLFSKLRFVFMTRYSKTNKHLFGRFWILLMVFINVLLSGLPSLFSKLYPVHKTSLPETQIFNVTIDSHLISNVYINPNSTSEADLSLSLGFPFGNYSFDHYSISAPKSIPCQHVYDTDLSTTFLRLRKGNHSVDITIDVDSLEIGNDDSPFTLHPGNTSAMKNIKATNVTFFNLTKSEDVDLLEKRRLSICQDSNSDNSQSYCLIHSISYAFLDDVQSTEVLEKNLVSISLPAIFLKLQGYFFDFTFCMNMPTPSLQHKCKLMTAFKDQVASYPAGGYEILGILGVQSIVNTTKGIHKEAVWIQGDESFLSVYAISSNFSVTIYESNPVMINSSAAIPYKTTFTTTYERSSFSGGVMMPPFLMNMGFPPESVYNITNFVLRGISAFGGSLVVSPTSLVAEIPEAFVIAVFAVALLCMIGGYIATYSVDPMVTRPLSEIIAASRTNTEGSSFKRNIVHLTLARNRGISRSSPIILVDSTRLDVENDEIQLLESEDIESCSSTLR